MTPRFDIGPVERLNWLLAGGAVLAALALATPRFALSLGLGAVLGAVNFRSLRSACERVVAGLLGQAVSGAGGIAVAGFGLRFVLMGAAVGVALHQGAHPVGLVIGLSTIVPAAVAGAWVARPRVDPEAPALPPDDPSWDEWNPWTARERDPEAEDED